MVLVPPAPYYMGAEPSMLEVSAHVSPVLSHFTAVEACTMLEPGRGAGSSWSGL